MKLRICGLLAIASFAVAGVISSAQTHAQNAYITNFGDNTVSVISTRTDTVTATIPVGIQPYGVAVAPDGSKAYITNFGSDTVSVISTSTNTVTATIPVGNSPDGVAVTPDGGRVYVANVAGPVSVIDAAKNTVTATINLPSGPGLCPLSSISKAVAVSPDGSKVYVVNDGGLSVIATATNTVIGCFFVAIHAAGVAVSPDGSKAYVTDFDAGVLSVVNTVSGAEAKIPLPGGEHTSGVAVTPDGGRVYVTDEHVWAIDTATDTAAIAPLRGGAGVAVTPDGSKVYVANSGLDSVSVIDSASNVVTATIPVGNSPFAFGVFIPIPVPQSAPVAGNLCNGIYKGAFNGNVTVSAGQDCIFLNGKITGNVSVVGGNFALNRATVGGNVAVNGSATYWLGPEATIGGNLKIQNIAPGSANNAICGTTVNGNMQFDSNGTAVQMGTTAPLFCSGNAINNNLEVVGNSSSALMFDNSVGGNMSVVDNTGPVDVVSNTVGSNLLCQGNTDLLMGGGNTARKITGQCNAGATAAAAPSPLVPN